jgi:hypothetical protein
VPPPGTAFTLVNANQASGSFASAVTGAFPISSLTIQTTAGPVTFPLTGYVPVPVADPTFLDTIKSEETTSGSTASVGDVLLGASTNAPPVVSVLVPPPYVPPPAPSPAPSPSEPVSVALASPTATAAQATQTAPAPAPAAASDSSNLTEPNQGSSSTSPSSSGSSSSSKANNQDDKEKSADSAAPAPAPASSSGTQEENKSESSKAAPQTAAAAPPPATVAAVPVVRRSVRSLDLEPEAPAPAATTARSETREVSYARPQAAPRPAGC